MKTTLFKIPNLRARTATPALPWDGKLELPEFADKESFRVWASSDTTDSVFVSAFEGVNPHGRINKNNEPCKMHGLIADYDTPLTDEVLLEGLARGSKIGFKPMYAHKTFSGGARVIWMFEEPIHVLPGVLKEFLGLLVRETKAKTLFPRLDEAIYKPDQYYAWMPGAIKFADTPIRSEAIHSLLGDAVEKSKKYRGEGDVQIPLEAIYQKVQEVYPGRWTGAFEEGLRGPLFWMEDGVDRVGAQITKTGMVSYSTRSTKGFMTWSDLFGAAWVREFQEDRFGGPMQTYWYDGKYYWKRGLENFWMAQESGNTRHDIVGTYSLSAVPDARGSLSEADEAMRRIRESRRVHGAIPCLYDPREAIVRNGKRILNIGKTRVMQPEATAGAWGENFPWLASFLDQAIDPIESLPFLLSWLKRFYVSALEGKLLPGQAVFIAGPVGQGKTFFGTEIVSRLLGGGCDASDYLVQGSSFNAELFEVALWNVDDSSSADSAEAHKRFSRMIKRGVANTKHTYHRKFHDAETVNWNGRIIDTLNDDPESIQAVPHTDGSILDKISLFKFKGHQLFENIGYLELEATLDQELPHLAAWLRDWEIPAECLGSKRYGVKSYHHPMLLAESRASSSAHGFSEFLELFLKNFKSDNPKATEWRGTSTDLLLAFGNDASLASSVKMFVSNSRSLGRMLASLGATGEKVERKTYDGFTVWKIKL